MTRLLVCTIAVVLTVGGGAQSFGPGPTVATSEGHALRDERPAPVRGEPPNRAKVATAPTLPLTAPLPSETQQDDGGAVVGGLASYVKPSYGSRYLALPGGPGIRVTICARGRCRTRVSTDAGPDLERQRAGLVADLSWSDFRYLCRCDPRLVGHIVVSVQYDELPRTDTAP